MITKEIDVMRQKGMMKIYTLEECMDEDLGVIGTPIRDAVEKEVRVAVDAYQESMRLKTQITTNKQLQRCRPFAVHNNKKTEGVFAPSIEWMNRVLRPFKTDRNELLSALS
jgi:hypothetical protein